MTRSNSAVMPTRWPIETIDIDGEILEMPAPHPLVQEVHDLEVRVVRLEERHDAWTSIVQQEKVARIADNASAVEHRNKLEDRMRRVEKIIWAGIGALGALQFVLKFIGHG